MRTQFAKPGSVGQQWWVVGLEGKTLGRAATEIAKVLRGKHKPTFTPHVDTGDFVVVGNDVQGRNCKLRSDHRHRQFRGFTNNDRYVVGPHGSFSLTVRFGVLERRVKIQHYGSIRSWEISEANLHKCRWFVVEVSVLGVSG